MDRIAPHLLLAAFLAADDVGPGLVVNHHHVEKKRKLTNQPVEEEEKMGWPEEWVQKSDKIDLFNYICSICKNVMKNAVQDRQGHCFCSDCISKAISLQWKCPLGREPLQLGDIREDKRIQLEISNLPIQCQFDPHKCNFSSRLKDGSEWKRHEKNCKAVSMCATCNQYIIKGQMQAHTSKCETVTKPCPFLCGEIVALKDMAEHQKTCSNKSIECECGEIVGENWLKNHKVYNCEEQLIPCPFQELGCPASFRRSVLDSHMKAEMDSHIEMTKFTPEYKRQPTQRLIYHWRFQFENERSKLTSETRTMFGADYNIVYGDANAKDGQFPLFFVSSHGIRNNRVCKAELSIHHPKTGAVIKTTDLTDGKQMVLYVAPPMLYIGSIDFATWNELETLGWKKPDQHHPDVLVSLSLTGYP